MMVPLVRKVIRETQVLPVPMDLRESRVRSAIKGQPATQAPPAHRARMVNQGPTGLPERTAVPEQSESTDQSEIRDPLATRDQLVMLALTGHLEQMVSPEPMVRRAIKALPETRVPLVIKGLLVIRDLPAILAQAVRSTPSETCTSLPDPETPQPFWDTGRGRRSEMGASC